MDMENPISRDVRARTEVERERIQRFISALNQALVVNGFSQRKLAAEIGVESGTFTKYMKGLIDPIRVGAGIQAALARTLGVTVDSLLAYYESGQYLNQLNADAVESWIRSEAGQEDLPDILQALTEAGDRWLRKSKKESAAALAPFSWPREEIEALGLPQKALEKLGIQIEAVERLEQDGLIDEALVEGFALLLHADASEVRRAFEERRPLSC